MKKVKCIAFTLAVLVMSLMLGTLSANAAEDYTYESEFAKLPQEVKSMENILLIDDCAGEAVVTSLGINKSGEHLYGDAAFTGETGGSLSLEFEGTVIGFLCQKGAFDIYIDNEFIETIVCVNQNGIVQLGYFNDQLENDDHIIEVYPNCEVAAEKTPEKYSVCEGFIVQEVPPPRPTPEPTAVPTEAPATAEPTAAPTAAPTAEPTAEPTAVPTEEEEGSNSTTIILIVIIVLILAVSLALIVIKIKKSK